MGFNDGRSHRRSTGVFRARVVQSGSVGDHPDGAGIGGGDGQRAVSEWYGRHAGPGLRDAADAAGEGVGPNKRDDQRAQARNLATETLLLAAEKRRVEVSQPNPIADQGVAPCPLNLVNNPG